MAIPATPIPADEQAFVTREINSLMRTPDWQSTVVIVNWDDSDGWYDHVYSGVTNPSLSPADNLTNTAFSGCRRRASAARARRRRRRSPASRVAAASARGSRCW